MKNIFKVSAIVLLLFVVPSQAQSTSDGRGMTTPKSTTPVWESERDLIVLLEDAVDRVTLAIQIMNASLDINNSLTPQQRYDGLNIAGHALWVEGDSTNALTCFSGIIALNITDDATADAARMQAQSLMGLGRWQEATDAYQLCYLVSKQIAATQGEHDLYKLIVVAYMNSAHNAGDFITALSLVDEVLTDYVNYPSESETRSKALDQGGRSAIETGELTRAEGYISTLLNSYPNYGMEFPGLRVNLEMNLLRTQGFTFENNDQQAIDKTMDIVMNAQYFGMPTWAHLVEQLSTMLDEFDGVDRANKLRLWSVDQMGIKANNLDDADPNTPIHRIMIRRIQTRTLSNAERKFRQAGKTVEQLEVLTRIVNEFADVNPQLTQYANEQLALIPAP